MQQTLKEYLLEKRLIHRGFVIVIALIGMIIGATLMLMFALLGMV